MNLSELIAQVELNLGRDDKTEHVPTWINLALEQISLDHPFAELEEVSYLTVDPSNSAIDPRRVELDPLLRSVHTLTIVNGRQKPLIRLTQQEYDKYFPEAVTAPEYGEPEYYTRYGKYFEVYPVPAKTYTYYMRWTKRHPRLLNSSDTPLIPYDSLIIAATMVIACQALDMPEEKAMYERDYYKHLNQTVRADTDKDEDEYLKMQGFSTECTRHVSDPRTDPFTMR